MIYKKFVGNILNDPQLIFRAQLNGFKNCYISLMILIDIN